LVRDCRYAACDGVIEYSVTRYVVGRVHAVAYSLPLRSSEYDSLPPGSRSGRQRCHQGS